MQFSTRPAIEIQEAHAKQLPEITLDGFERTETSFDGLQFSNEQAKIYLKPCHEFWRPEHSPLICWRGSGYEFSHEALSKIGTTEVYTALLSKDGDILYTSWWFQNTERITTGQLDWRWDAATGGQTYALVNVTCAEQSELEDQVRALTDGQWLNTGIGMTP